jgi:Phytochelatin synthase
MAMVSRDVLDRKSCSLEDSVMRPVLRRLILVGFLLLATDAAADTLTLPDNLIDLRSPQGEALLLETPALDAYFSISVAFETQKTQAYCGVASTVMALNALHVPAPTTAEYQPYHVFTQDNFFNDQTEAILPRAVLAHHGMTLDQLGQLLGLHPIVVEVHHAAAGGLDEFRKSASEYLASKNHFVIVNYLRKSLGQERGGHISPLAAYDKKADRFLILDVARYKYPPVWVSASDLFDAMNTTDSDNDNKTRGYVLISNKESETSPPVR